MEYVFIFSFMTVVVSAGVSPFVGTVQGFTQDTIALTAPTQAIIAVNEALGEDDALIL